MAQPSVAREPSMEEILASIRRIIESNEPASADAFSAPLPPVYDEEEEAGVSFATELASPPPHVPPAANQGYGMRQQPDISSSEGLDLAGGSSAEKSMSLADVAARVRAAADRNATLGPQGYTTQRLVEPAAVSQPSFTPQRPTDVRPLMNVAPAPVRSQPEPVQSFARPVAAPEPQPIPAWENLELRGAVEPEMPVAAKPEYVAEQPVLAVPETRIPEVQVQEDVVPQTRVPEKRMEESNLSLNLISAAAGAQIAQSFGELEALFDGVERPTVEQMAQDMLRPMLQDWLEDNLPTLVERLVREEIERVARGPRR